ncbi:MAG: type II toxin-antitoxin system VapC family toxin [Solirubrobacteraceae bacterium]
MGTLILDASVLIGLLDAADARHGQAVDDVEATDLAGEGLLAPASAYSEVLVSFARARRISDARDAITAMGIAVTPMTNQIAESAAELRATHDRLRLPDAIVLATAKELQARLLTYDDGLAKIARGGITADSRPRPVAVHHRVAPTVGGGCDEPAYACTGELGNRLKQNPTLGPLDAITKNGRRRR